MKELAKHVPYKELADACACGKLPVHDTTRLNPWQGELLLFWPDAERLWPHISSNKQQRRRPRGRVHQQRDKTKPLPAKKQQTTQQLRKGKLTAAVEARLKAGYRPVITEQWGPFCDRVRDNLKVPRDAYGYSDKTIKRTVAELQQTQSK
jgi:hypothetical protein